MTRDKFLVVFLAGTLRRKLKEICLEDGTATQIATILAGCGVRALKQAVRAMCCGHEWGTRDAWAWRCSWAALEVLTSGGSTCDDTLGSTLDNCVTQQPTQATVRLVFETLISSLLILGS